MSSGWTCVSYDLWIVWLTDRFMFNKVPLIHRLITRSNVYTVLKTYKVIPFFCCLILPGVRILLEFRFCSVYRLLHINHFRFRYLFRDLYVILMARSDFRNHTKLESVFELKIIRFSTQVVGHCSWFWDSWPSSGHNRL